MSEADGLEINGGRLQDFTIDQLAGAIALSLGAVGTLLLVIWQSRCVCKAGYEGWRLLVGDDALQYMIQQQVDAGLGEGRALGINGKGP